jgi:hypothetical protein
LVHAHRIFGILRLCTISRMKEDSERSSIYVECKDRTAKIINFMRASVKSVFMT